MIQTQSQNEEIRQIIKVWDKVDGEVRWKVFWDVGDKVWDKVGGKVRSEVWRKLLI